MNGLRIVEAKIDGQIFPISLPELDSFPNNYITVVIGNNATGKSRLLNSMLNRLRNRASSKQRGVIEEIELLVHANGELIDTTNDDSYLLNEINLISISNSLFDKFPFDSRSESNYSYVGARQEGIGLHKKAIIHDLMDVLSSNLEDSLFRQKSYELFKLLKLSSKIDISLRERSYSNSGFYDLLFANNSINSLSSYLKELSKKPFYRNQAKYIQKIVLDEKFMNGFHEYLNDEFGFVFKRSSMGAIDYRIDLLRERENEDFIVNYKYFSFIRRLNFITYSQILLEKLDGRRYDIMDSSTGEIGLLITFLRALPLLRPNSIIFIDEPEISLHPSWQMQYIDLLLKFLEGYTSCHVIIATHSHLILSDLRNEWSSLLTLRTDELNQTIAELKPYTPFGWAPEAILYDVFGVVTVRNQLFEFELAKLLDLIAIESDDLVEINKHIARFESFKYTEADPLNLIIQEAKTYVASKQYPSEQAPTVPISNPTE